MRRHTGPGNNATTFVRLDALLRPDDVATPVRGSPAHPRATGVRLALVLLVAQVVPAPASAMRLFVANSGDDTVSVVDTDLDREVQTIPVGKSPSAIVLRADPPLVAVANSQASNATLIDPVRLTVLPRVVATAMGPESVAFADGGCLLFATSFYAKVVTASDVETGEQVGAPIAFDGTPRRLLPSRDGRRLFVLLHGESGAVAALDVATRTVTGTVKVGPFPSDLVLTPDGTRLLVASFDASSVAVVDVASLAVVDTLTVDTGYGLVVHPTRPLLYSMVSFDDTVQVYDYAARQAGAAIPVGSWPTYSAITPDGRYLYVVNRESNNVVKVDTAAGAAVLRIATGVEPQAAVLFAAGRAAAPRPYATVAAIAVTVAALVVWWLGRRSASEDAGSGGSPPSPA